MTIACNRRLTECVLAALTLACVSVPAQATPDCIDNTRRTIVGGGTNGVTAIFAADLNGDTFIDVLTASTNDDKILWFRSDGGSPPSFSEQRPITTSADGIVAIYAGDLDGDLDIDIVSASGNDDRIAWYENLGGPNPNFIKRSLDDGADNASSVFIGDIDGDGNNDVASASSNDDTIRWYKNDGTQPPGFTPIVVSTTADGASSVFAADLFADPSDDLELLSASLLDDTISWYERVVEKEEQPGKELGKEEEETFVYVEHVVDAAADGASAVFAANLDGDTDIDIVAASSIDDRITWYRSDGMSPPSFTKNVITTQADGASAVFAANLDGDMDIDVLSASSRDGTIAWYENLGDGTFGARIVITDAAPGASGLFAIDLDQDPGGTIDVLAASSEAGAIAANDKIAWHENDGTPLFTEREISSGAIAPESILIEQVDDLGGLDVIAASSVDDSIYWFENDGLTPPTFIQHLLTDDAPGAVDLFWADVGGSAEPDLIVALADVDTIAWYENMGGGIFGGRNNIAAFAADGASSVFAINLDGDGGIDILSTSSNDNKVSWYRNAGGGAFDAQQNLTEQAMGAQSVVAGDLDDDGDIDVVAASVDDDTVRWFENDGMLPPSFTEHPIEDINGALINGPYALALADIDQDLDAEMAMDLDVVVATAFDARVVWFKQFTTILVEDDPKTKEDETEEGIGWTREIVFTGATFPRAVAVADLDGDLDPDIVSAASGTDTVRWHQSPLDDPELEVVDGVEPFIAFIPRTVTAVAESVRDVAVADIDNDGKLDIVTAFLFEIAWHAGDSEEICGSFDVEGGAMPGEGDGKMDGQELSLLGAAFGWICPDPMNPPDPAVDPRINIDYTADCQVDGDDLAVLTSLQVWGNTVDDCAYTCP